MERRAQIRPLADHATHNRPSGVAAMAGVRASPPGMVATVVEVAFPTFHTRIRELVTPPPVYTANAPACPGIATSPMRWFGESVPSVPGMRSVVPVGAPLTGSTVRAYTALP